MLFVVISILCVLCGLILFRYFNYQNIPSNRKLPPIYHGLPIVGTVFEMNPTMYGFLLNLIPKMGPIFMIKMGMRQILVVNNYDWFKRCFKENAENFSGRYSNSLVKTVSHDSGIFFKHGKSWKILRSFILQTLKDFGVGKSKSFEIVELECLNLLNDLEKCQGQAFNFVHTIPWYTFNIISKFIMNKRYDKDDKKIKAIKEVIELITTLDNLQLLLMMFPFLNNPLLSKIIFSFFKQKKEFNEVHQIFFDEIEEHRKNLSNTTEGEDLIDRFLIEQSSSKINSEYFKDWELVRISYELIVAGYETTSSTLSWAMLLLSKHPQIQQYMFNEIKETIGVNRRVTMNDKKQLHYTQAVMDEVTRLNSVAPLALFHQTLHDSVIGDKYFIPGNTLVIPNIYACFRDPDIWCKPNDFYPEHFLNKVDNKWQYCAREELIAFGMGKRQCAGESLARMEYFLFLVSIIQKFKVDFTDKYKEEDYENTLKGKDTLLRTSLVTDFLFTIR